MNKINIKHQVLLILKILLPFVVIYVLYIQMSSDFNQLEKHFTSFNFTFLKSILLILLLILMFINWFVESLKWKFLVDKIKEISLKESLKSIYNGLAFGLITPFKIGEVFSRILHIDSNDRSKALGSLLVSRASQLTSTCFFGLLGLGFFCVTFLGTSNLLWVVILILIISSLLIYFNLNALIPFLDKFNFTNNYIHYINVMYEYDRKEYLITLILSFLRYAIFVLQYYIMFFFYGVEISMINLFTGISLVFLVKSILPISILGDFGIREITAISVFGIMGLPKPLILIITVSIWMLNIILPSLIGSFLSKK